MSMWKNDDSAGNSAIYAPAQFNQTVNTDNQTALFGNTTANAFVHGETIGQYGVGTAEMIAARAAGLRPAHAGWVLKRTGSGGRAGRTSYEVLVAMGSMTGDAEDTAFPNYTISIITNPANRTINASSASNVATFSVNAASIPSGASLGYFWQKWGGSAFANLSAAGAYSNVTTATLSVLANTASNGEIYRVGVTANGGATTTYSSNAVITITT